MKYVLLLIALWACSSEPQVLPDLNASDYEAPKAPSEEDQIALRAKYQDMRRRDLENAELRGRIELQRSELYSRSAQMFSSAAGNVNDIMAIGQPRPRAQRAYGQRLCNRLPNGGFQCTEY